MYFSFTFYDPYPEQAESPDKQWFHPTHEEVDLHKVYENYAQRKSLNTWDDFFMIPTSRPVINPPARKESFIDISGMDGSIDGSNGLRGYPTFSRRTGSVEFLVENGHNRWYQVYSGLLNYLHGRELIMIMEEVPTWFYKGVWKVNQWKSDQHYSTITLDYNLDPYIYRTFGTMDDWLWDPFNFDEDYVISDSVFRDIPVNTETQQVIWNSVGGNIPIDKWGSKSGVVGTMPVCPYFYFESKDGSDLTEFWFRNCEFMKHEAGYRSAKHILKSGEWTQFDDVIFTNKTGLADMSLFGIGKGTLSIDYRPGRL